MARPRITASQRSRRPSRQGSSSPAIDWEADRGPRSARTSRTSQMIASSVLVGKKIEADLAEADE